MNPNETETELVPCTLAPLAPLIHARISAVMGDIDAVGKLGKNREQGYSFRSIDDFYDAIQPALYKHRVFITPTILEHAREQRTTKSGAILMTTLTKVRFRIWTEDGSFVEADALGEGADSGDKSSNKAASGALKYLFMQVFAVRVNSENHDTEVESPVYHAPQPASPAPKPEAPAPKPTPRAMTPEERKATLLAKLKGVEAEATKVFVEEGLIFEGETFADISTTRIELFTPDQMLALIKTVKMRKADNDQLDGAEMPSDVPVNVPVNTGIVEETSEKTGTTKAGKPWTRYGIKISGAWHNTFDRKHFEIAETRKGQPVIFTATQTQYGSDLQTIEEQQ